MTKLMAFDLDGTILFNRAVEPATEQAIARWQAEGNLAVSCTGKSIFATQLALNPTAIRFDYHVLYTGAVITDRQYRVIYHQPLPVSVVQAGGTISRKSWFLWQSTESPKRSRIQVYAASRT